MCVCVCVYIYIYIYIWCVCVYIYIDVYSTLLLWAAPKGKPSEWVFPEGRTVSFPWEQSSLSYWFSKKPSWSHTIEIWNWANKGVVKVLVAQPCPTLFDPIDCSPPGSSVHGILQARILEWVAIPFSRGSSWPRDRTWVSRIAGRFFTIWATREAQEGGTDSSWIWPWDLLYPKWESHP